MGRMSSDKAGSMQQWKVSPRAHLRTHTHTYMRTQARAFVHPCVNITRAVPAFMAGVFSMLFTRRLTGMSNVRAPADAQARVLR